LSADITLFVFCRSRCNHGVFITRCLRRHLIWFLHHCTGAQLYDFVLCGWMFCWLSWKWGVCRLSRRCQNEWMNDLVDRNQHSDWIPDNSCCFRVGPITCSLACLYGNLLNGCQGLRPKTFTQGGRKLYGVLLSGGIKHYSHHSESMVLVHYLAGSLCPHVWCNNASETNTAPLQNGRPRK